MYSILVFFMKNIKKYGANNENIFFALRLLISKLDKQVTLYNKKSNYDVDIIKNIVHLIEFDFFDCRISKRELDIVVEARTILKENDYGF